MGRVPLYPGTKDETAPGVSGWESIEHIGPLTRTVADGALMIARAIAKTLDWPLDCVGQLTDQPGHDPHHNVVVERLKAAGAVIIGKTNVPEFGYSGASFNLIFPPTKNPLAAQERNVSPARSRAQGAAATRDTMP
jgi:Asp-tRNA(Asn)/Glu-tRNA(Gln) amidotransferase A subunit family amidase